MQAHCQSHTSQRFNQSFVKELANANARETPFTVLKNLPTLKKKINADIEDDRNEIDKYNVDELNE